MSATTTGTPTSVLNTGVGVTFTARYIGSLPILASMKILDFESRSLLIRQAITRVVIAAGLPLKYRMVNFNVLKPDLASMLSETVDLVDGGTDVIISVTTTYLASIKTSSGAILFQHPLSRVSFSLANGGDDSVEDRRYLAYVVNDGTTRRCIVLDADNRAAEVATTIGHAFEMSRQSTPGPSRPAEEPVIKFNPFKTKVSTSGPSSSSAKAHFSGFSSSIPNSASTGQSGRESQPEPEPDSEPIYYNDIQGKIPPPDNPALYRRVTGHNFNPFTQNPQAVLTPIAEESALTMQPTPLPARTTTFICPQSTPAVTPVNSEDIEDFESLSLGCSEATSSSESSQRNISRFNGSSNLNSLNTESISSSLEDLALESAIWYHGAINRSQAESLMHRNGQFLARLTSTPSSDARYALTTLQRDIIRHVLLPQTQDGVICEGRHFVSVSAMLEFYISQERALMTMTGELLWLKLPVMRLC